jgi:hypothetical protein
MMIAASDGTRNLEAFRGTLGEAPDPADPKAN